MVEWCDRGDIIVIWQSGGLARGGGVSVAASVSSCWRTWDVKLVSNGAVGMLKKVGFGEGIGGAMVKAARSPAPSL